jgi:hypothetical protein
MSSHGSSRTFGIPPVVVFDDDAHAGEARPQRAARAVAPQDAAELVAAHSLREPLDAERVSASTAVTIDQPHLGRRLDTDGVVEIEKPSS